MKLKIKSRQYTVALINPTFKCFLLDCLSYLMRDALPPLISAFVQTRLRQQTACFLT